MLDTHMNTHAHFGGKQVCSQIHLQTYIYKHIDKGEMQCFLMEINNLALNAKTDQSELRSKQHILRETDRSHFLFHRSAPGI